MTESKIWLSEEDERTPVEKFRMVHPKMVFPKDFSSTPVPLPKPLISKPEMEKPDTPTTNPLEDHLARDPNDGDLLTDGDLPLSVISGPDQDLITGSSNVDGLPYRQKPNASALVDDQGLRQDLCGEDAE